MTEGGNEGRREEEGKRLLVETDRRGVPAAEHHTDALTRSGLVAAREQRGKGGGTARLRHNSEYSPQLALGLVRLRHLTRAAPARRAAGRAEASARPRVAGPANPLRSLRLSRLPVFRRPVPRSAWGPAPARRRRDEAYAPSRNTTPQPHPAGLRRPPPPAPYPVPAPAPPVRVATVPCPRIVSG